MAFYGALGRHPGGPSHPNLQDVSYGQQAYPIVGGLWPGRMIRVTGMPTPTANRFVVCLNTRRNVRSADIAFKMDVRFLWGGDTMMVLRNSRLQSLLLNDCIVDDREWQIPDRYTPFFPLLPGSYFELVLFIEAQCTRVLVNNQPWFEYDHENHGLRLRLVNSLWIAGDVMLHHVQIT